MKILILTDGKAGHENQSRAFARALGGEAEIRQVRFKSRLHKALSYLFDRIGLRTSMLFSLGAPVGGRQHSCECDAGGHEPSHSAETGSNCSFDVVIGTGSGTFYAAKTLASTIGAKCGVVLYPRGYDIASFDCILAPSFDCPPAAPNVLEIPANLVASDAAFYEQGVAAFLEHYGRSARPVESSPSFDGRTVFGQHRIVAVIVGGPNKCSTLTPEWMRECLAEIFAGNQPTPSDPRPVKFWVTTSRRTPPDVEKLVDSFPWDYKLIYSRDHFNPIPAFVSLADVLHVTAESTGMLSEACTFGTAEVRALDNLNPGPHKFRRFLENLAENGYINGRRKIDLSIQFSAARALLSKTSH